jgi:molybdopterin-guanine dinucleotide biosynthesis protein A
MGADKALLIYHGKPLILRTAAILEEVAETVTVVGSQERYGSLGLRIIEDCFPNSGPLAGIHAALQDSALDWNLIVACDMPALTARDLNHLCESAPDDVEAVIPVSADGQPQPLCALYHRRALSLIESALNRGERKILRAINAHLLEWQDNRLFRNINTPEEWSEFASS